MFLLSLIASIQPLTSSRDFGCHFYDNVLSTYLQSFKLGVYLQMNATCPQLEGATPFSVITHSTGYVGGMSGTGPKPSVR